MSPEIVRRLAGGLLCAALLLIFGFLPVWISGTGAWSASNPSRVAMPIGESKPAELRAPYDLKKPAGIGLPSARR